MDNIGDHIWVGKNAIYRHEFMDNDKFNMYMEYAVKDIELTEEQQAMARYYWEKANPERDERWEHMYASITPCEWVVDSKVVRIMVIYNDLMYISQFIMNPHQEPYFKIIINQLVEEMDKQLK